ncbi:MAG: chromate efflux transporter [Pirellulales bacterium]
MPSPAITTVPDSRGAWKTWLAIGAGGFGGPAGQVALLHREVVERRRWLGEEEFLAAMRLCMLLPGPEAQQLATYAGWRLGGIPGGLVAGTLFVLPGALLVALLAWAHAAGAGVPLVAAAFAGMRPAVVAVVALAAWRIGRRSLTAWWLGIVAAVAVGSLVAGCPFPAVAVGAALLGAVIPAGSAAAREPSDGRLPRGPSARRHAAIVAAVAVALWLAAYGLVVITNAAGGRGPAIATLFSETTLLSLGGAYAVVPWALDEAVARGWLEPPERFDALAMGEATPGPLILVVTFIGFLAGWRTGGGTDIVAGLQGASIATLFAFIPSFAMVLPLAPFVARIHPGSRLARAMAAIGAVVVAAIVLLAIRLAAAAWLPDGAPEIVPMAASLVAACALAIGKVPTPIVIVAAAALGIATAAVGG